MCLALWEGLQHRENCQGSEKGEAQLTEKRNLVYVKYRDHVLFRNADPSLFRPSVREVVGWLLGETEEVLCLCYERAIERLPFEKPSEQGIIILKSAVLELSELDVKETSSCKIAMK